MTRLAPGETRKAGRATTPAEQTKEKRQMKTGKTLQALAQQIQAEQAMKKDFIADTRNFNMSFDGADAADDPAGGALIEFEAGGNRFQAKPTKLCLGQIGERVGIPAKYIERLNSPGNRGLLAANVNHWFQTAPDKRMLRTFINGEQTARAFLSDRYRPLDNADLANAVIPRLMDAGCEVISSEITEKRLYIQAATPRLELDLSALRAKHGNNVGGVDPVQAGIVISNSEVGCGSIKVEPMIYRLRCFNGLIIAEAIRRHHVGKANGGNELDSAEEYFTTATRELDDRAFWAKVCDVVAGVMDKGRFEGLVQKFANAGAVEIGDPIKAVEIVTERMRLSENESGSILSHLAKGGDINLFGLVNAVTRSAEDAPDYDRAVELERIGGAVLELPANVFSRN